ncbi:hypothetical protein U9M48_012128, partial [Paspalum notatum var. saurae]
MSLPEPQEKISVSSPCAIIVIGSLHYVVLPSLKFLDRLTAIGSVDRPCDALAQKDVEALAQMLDQHNPFAKKFRLAKDRLADHEDENFVVRIVGAGEGDPVQYNLPTTDQLAMLVVGDFTLDIFKRDIVIEARVYGPPDFFTTFTCNAKCPEIAEAIACHPGQKPSDRADMIVRVYNMKLEELMEDVRGGTAFGPVAAVLHTVEFQKRGLPHAHIIIWLLQDTSQPTPDFINRFISAEIPDPNEDPLGYALVAEHMMHGSYGPTFPRCPCMKKGRCSKGYPKPFQEITTITEDGFAVYKRPDNS